MEQISSDRVPPLSSKYPWLIAKSIEEDEKHNAQDQFFCTLNNELPHYRCRIPELLGKRIRGYFHGWVILSNHPYNNIWSLWNHVTSKIISLPTLVLEDGDYESIRQSCLSAPPDDPSSILLLTRTNHVCPFDYYGCGGDNQYLKGSSTELFYIEIAFDEETFDEESENTTEKKPTDVCLFKSDMTCINWEERECFKDWDITSVNTRVPGCDDLEDSSSEDSVRSSEIWTNYYRPEMDMSRKVWEVIDDLKDAIFFMDVSCDYSVSYSPVVTSKLGGFIHIRGEMGKTIYSYNVKDNTISLSSIPSPMLPTSHVSMWECRLEDDHGEAKCVVDYKEEMGNNNQEFLRSGSDYGVESKNSHLLNIPSDLLETIMELCLGVEYMNFRATCKRCLLVAPLIKWSNETSLRKLQTHSLVSPWLMVVDRKRGIITFTDPMSGDNYFLKNSKVLIDENDRICYSRFGWLLFKKRDLNRLVFFNPFTDDLRELPAANYDLEGLCFSAPPTSLDCMVVGFTTERVYFHFVNRQRTWRERRVDTNPHNVCFSAFYDRDLFVFCEEGEVIIINNLGKEDCTGDVVEHKAPK
nr:hypothetical protein CTI12_AA475860 [Tanacetum cinerariifolium]